MMMILNEPVTTKAARKLELDQAKWMLLWSNVILTKAVQRRLVPKDNKLLCFS